MDKDKVIKLINKTISELSATNMGIICTQSTLEAALEELQKPDWISVEDELPPYDEKVLVCNKYHTNNVWISHREEEGSPRHQDENGFPAWQYCINPYSITHWRKIDKLEVWT